MFTGYKGAAKRLDNIDLPKIGAQIGVGEDELHAFMDVECSGAGFDAKGRVKMLFEPHVFYRELGPGKKRERAVREGLAYAKWRSVGYPADSYPRLLAAMQIDETAALSAASWGLGQIMGFNCGAAGYRIPQDMVKSFAADEVNQLQGMVNFLKSKGLAAALKEHDWAKIERVYNGGGFKGAYAAKMMNAFTRWQTIKDTPWNPEKQEEPATPLPELDPAPEAPAIHIEPTSADPDSEVLRTKKKPVLKHRRVWTTIMGFITGGGAWSFASLSGFDWQSVAVIVGAGMLLILFFWLMYRREIHAGMFGPEEGK